jgi:hypothetical protein
MTADPQLPLEPTLRIDPSPQVRHLPGTDAICECATYDQHRANADCLWPFCGWKQHLKEDDAA